MPPKLTASQKEVLALYRRGLRAIRHKPEENQPSFLLYLRYFFKHPSQGGGLRRRDFSAIEYMLRRGNRMVEDIYESKGVTSVHLPSNIGEWRG